MRKILTLATTLAITLSVSAPASAVKLDDTQDKWLVYWYISGSNLESEFGQATSDMKEMEVAIPKVDLNLVYATPNEENGGNVGEDYIRNLKTSRNIKFLIQTGGADRWDNSRNPTETVGRYVYDSDGWHYLGALADADMGDSKTLADFLKYGKEQIEPDFQPDHRIFVFWDHGDFLSVCYDYRHEDGITEFLPSALYLNDIKKAFTEVFPNASATNPPFEIIGFDACYRATYENANNLYGFTKYMVASQEMESGLGWYYTDWVKAIADNSSIGGKQLARTICDGAFNYIEEVDQYQENKEAPLATFSVIDLSKDNWENLRTAYDTFDKSLIKMTNKYSTEAYNLIGVAMNGLHYKAQLFDLKSFAERIKLSVENSDSIDRGTKSQVIKASNDLIVAINSAVAYNKHGDSTTFSNGISAYYPNILEPDQNMQDDFALYSQQKSTPKSNKKLVGNFLKNVEILQNQMKAESDSEAAEITFDISDSKSTKSKSRAKSQSKSQSKSKSKSNKPQIDISQLQNVPVQVETVSGDYKYEISTRLNRDQVKSISNVGVLVGLAWEDPNDVKDDASLQKILGENAPAIQQYIAGIDEEDYGAASLILGFNSNINSDWNQGYFSSNLNAGWISIDGNVVLADIDSFQADVKDSSGNVIQWGYTNYAIPILLNGDSYILKVSYRNSDKKYVIIGADASSGYGKAGRALRRSNRGYTLIKEGDVITPIFTVMLVGKNISDSPNTIVSQDTENGMHVVLNAIKGKSFTVGKNLSVSNTSLPEGEYFMTFSFQDAFARRVTSDLAMFSVDDAGEIYYAETRDEE